MTSRSHLLPFAAATALAATMLFVLESLVGKQLLPVAGGGPMIWNTCLVFFQATLFVAYFIVYLLSRFSSFPIQALLALALLFLALLAPSYLTQGLNSAPPIGSDPQWWLWYWLGSAVALPFLALAVLSPLLQYLFPQRVGKNDAQPYILYAASNIGSFLGLLVYPLFIERHFLLSEQRLILKWGYIAILLLVAVCIFLSHRSRPQKEIRPDDVANLETVGLSRILTWVSLAALPSSLLLSVTTYILTDVSAIPLFWMLPLLLYLLTFVIAFAALSKFPLHKTGRVAAFLILPLIITFTADANSPAALLVPLHLLAFFLVSLYCHAVLVASRPSHLRNLTAFYLWISAGGVLGGALTLFLMPLLFSRQLEYPLALIAVCALRALGKHEVPKLGDIYFFVALLALLLGSSALLTACLPDELDSLSLSLQFIPAAVIALSCIHIPRRYTFGLAAIFIGGVLIPSGLGQSVAIYRNFFGITRVTLKDGAHRIIHGSTIHGVQKVDEMNACNPTSYFHPSGPASDVLTIPAHVPRERVLVIGLGVGTLLCYSRPNEHWVSFELNPAMEEIARNEKYFTFIRNAPTKNITIQIGDGRRLLQSDPSLAYDIIVMDAFSSDSIPTHLLTKEALSLYLSRLKPDGKVLIQISNRYFDLRRILREMPAVLPINVFLRDDLDVSSAGPGSEKTPSSWILLGPNVVAPSTKWKQLFPTSAVAWSDEFSDVLSALKWSNSDPS